MWSRMKCSASTLMHGKADLPNRYLFCIDARYQILYYAPKEPAAAHQ